MGKDEVIGENGVSLAGQAMPERHRQQAQEAEHASPRRGPDRIEPALT